MPTAQNDELLRLQRLTRDIKVVTSLPSIWVHYTVDQIANSLAETLHQNLNLEFTCVYLTSSHENSMKAYGTSGLVQTERLTHFSAIVDASLESGELGPGPRTLPSPLDGREISVFFTPIGNNFKNGALMTSASRPDFPSDSERLILDIASSQSNVVAEYKWAQHEAIHAQGLAEENSLRLANIVLQLESEKELRERFVSALTHDLRTPLTAAKMSAQLLSRKADDPKMVQMLAIRIAKNMDRSDHMIQDLLDANRIKAGEGIPIHLQACNFVGLIRESISLLEQLYGQRFVLRVACEDAVGSCDIGAMERVIENLASNAVKYGTPGTPITVQVARHQENWIQLSVHNEGSPIPPEDQETLFSQFRRTVSADSSGKKGWGIGLNLVRGITEAHGGNVSVESIPGNGTLFTVQLPLNGKDLSS